MKDHFTEDTPEDRRARKLIDAERKAALFDHAMEEAKQVPKRMDDVKKLTAKVEALERALDRPQRIEATLKAPAPIKGDVPLATEVEAVGSAAVAEFLRFSSQNDVDQTLRQLFPGDAGRMQRKAVKGVMAKSASNPAMTTDAGWAAELVSSATGAWVDELATVSVFGAIATRGRPLPMGDANTITYPHRAPGNAGDMAQSFITEGGTIPVKQGMFASTTFQRRKAGVITVATNELRKTAVHPLRQILTDMILDDTALMLDSVILNPANAAVTNIRPASPWNSASNQPSTGTDLAAIIADLSWLIGQIDRPKNPLIIMDTARELRLKSWRDNMGWVFGSEMASGTILGTPYLASATVPTSQVYIIDADDFLSWTPAPEIDMSQTATIVMANDSGIAPTMADTNAVNDAGGSIHVSDAPATTPPTVVRSTFQTDSTALRVIQPIEFGMLRTGRTSYLTSVGW